MWDKFSRQMFATEFDKGKGNTNETLKLFKNNTMTQQIWLNFKQLLSAYAKFNAFIREFQVSNKKEQLAIGN